MDAVELGRQEAARLHDAAVALGHDPWLPMAMVGAAARACGISEINGVKPGSPLLTGARAKFDPLSKSILHENTGNDFLTAFLIAHELGHAVLGDARLPDQTCDVDPARSSEAAPVGEERVADYSRKSRREVQMDLFARELLMPRHVVRAHHLAGMTASDIATRLGATFDAVAQQLLDALLLPPILRDDDDEEALPPLNDRQRDAAEHEGAGFLLEAGPGTGKTKTLVGRVCDLVERHNVDPRGIVVLTYSNKAAGELSERIARHVPEAAAAMWIGTFHAYGLNLVRQFHAALGFTREPRLLDKTEAIALMLDRVPGLDLRHYRDLLDPTDKLRDLLSGISRAQDEVVLAPDYAALVEAMRARDPGAAMSERVAQLDEVARVYTSYTEAKMSLDRIDFGDLVALPTHLLETRPDISQQVRAGIAHVLVDEYQDVNRASVRLLQQLCEKGRNLWCVGDIRQSIYRFRGASSFNLAGFDTGDFPEAKRGQLDVNYRSRKEIVDAYSAFAQRMPVTGATPVDLESYRKACGYPVEFRHAVGEKAEEIDAIADAIDEMRNGGFAYRDQALLCSGNDRLAEIGAGLEARGIPVLYLGSLFERPEVKDLLAWLSLLIDRRAMGLARSRVIPDFALPLADVAAISAALAADAAEPLAWTHDALSSLSAEGRQAVANYAALFAGFGPGSPPWETLAKFLLDRSRIAAHIASTDAVAARAQGIALWQFMNFVRAQPLRQDDAIAALLDRIRHLVRLADDRDLRHLPQAASGIDAVRLMTMHGSKGLEFRVVHLPGITKGTLPRGPQPPACPPPDGMIMGAEGHGREITDREHREEQECLFYVALSRARDRLLLYSPSRQSGGNKRNPSDFVDRLGSDLVRKVVTPRNYGIDTAVAPVAIAYLGQPAFRQSELGLYERCPRRFFYTYVLKLGGKRTTTAYEDMHDVVRGVMRELLSLPDRLIDPATLFALTELHWAASPLAALPTGVAYRPLADELINRFAEIRAHGDPRPRQSLSFTRAGAHIQVDYDYALTVSGRTVLRQIQTGHKRVTVMKGAVIMTPLLAALDAAPGHDAELAFLADGEVVRLALDASDIAKRRGILDDMVTSVLAGRFDPKPSPRNCPKCPAFFACGPLPVGPMEKNFA